MIRMKKNKLYTLVIITITFWAYNLYPQEEDQDILPEFVLAFPFGSNDYKHKIHEGLENSVIWSEQKIAAWAQSKGFLATPDHSDGGYQYRRGMVFHSPGLSFMLKTPLSAEGVAQAYGWQLILDCGVFYSNPFEEVLSSNFKFYENILRYEVWIDNIYYQTIEMGYGVTVRSPISISIPLVRDTSGVVSVELRMKNHPANFGIIYDAFLFQDSTQALP